MVQGNLYNLEYTQTSSGIIQTLSAVVCSNAFCALLEVIYSAKLKAKWQLMLQPMLTISFILQNVLMWNMSSRCLHVV